MPHYEILLGSAPEDFRQKKLEDIFDFLNSKKNAGDSIVTFANGISELMLEMVLDNSIKQLTDYSEHVVSTGSTTTEKNLRLSAESAGDFSGGAR